MENGVHDAAQFELLLLLLLLLLLWQNVTSFQSCQYTVLFVLELLEPVLAT